MTTTDTVTTDVLVPELAEYARELLAAGFRVYVFRRRPAAGRSTSFSFTREVGGRVCRGCVERDFSEHRFTMPIRPTRAYGSSMFVERCDDALTVANAELVASPENWNPLVGRQRNDADAAGWFERLYAEVTA